MFYKCNIIVNIRHNILRSGIFGLFIFLVFCMQNIPALGQVFPLTPYIQSYIPLSLNGYNFNPYSTGFSTSFTNPYLGLYNPFSVFNSYSSFNSAPFFPQATVAGGLIPFTSLYANPFAFPYAAAANYFIAQVLPADVAGAWSGIWISTFLAGGVTTGDLSITLAQAGIDVTGTVAFFLNKILKFGADVVGTVEGNTLTLSSTVVPGAGGTKTFDVTISAKVNGTSMDGTYLVINNVTGNVAEEGTFTANKL